MTTQHSPGIAERDWWRHATVRTLADVTTGSPYADRLFHHQVGQVLSLWQFGWKGSPIDTTTWHTSTDVDLTSFLLDEAVEVIEILEEVPPLLADLVQPMHAWLARRWARAAALFTSASSDAAMTRADWVMLHDHRQQITRDVQDQVTRLHRSSGRPEPELLSLAADILEEVVRPWANGYRWNVDSAHAVAADLRALAAGPAAAGHLRERLWAADDALDTALQVDGAVGVDARLTPRERQEAGVRFGTRLAAMLDTEPAAQAEPGTTADPASGGSC
ncbi:hypothetical protein ETD86_29595 [Nonomuraea turkmeniaca]|uniref:Uncharacterized protein n=1 Tax=Nonomuraea turkmeniaca TaxID=103838 RepID=A0A5S4FAC3_9ACTN|nr:hypothetical protein [Nonomuraea turkmeniaca]TMR14102.1 hypothetical protein ETD86_29595 [Nonomuraea turkmeniaca]